MLSSPHCSLELEIADHSAFPLGSWKAVQAIIRRHTEGDPPPRSDCPKAATRCIKDNFENGTLPAHSARLAGLEPATNCLEGRANAKSCVAGGGLTCFFSLLHTAEAAGWGSTPAAVGSQFGSQSPDSSSAEIGSRSMVYACRLIKRHGSGARRAADLPAEPSLVIKRPDLVSSPGKVTFHRAWSAVPSQRCSPAARSRWPVGVRRARWADAPDAGAVNCGYPLRCVGCSRFQ